MVPLGRVATLAVCLCLAACRGYNRAENAAMQSAKELDAIAEDLEEYGSISASPAVLVRKPDKYFGFSLNLSAKEIFERERVEAASAISDFAALEARVSVALNLMQQASAATDPTDAAQLQGQAEGVLAAGLVGAVEGGLASGTEVTDDAASTDDTADDAAEEETKPQASLLPENLAKGTLPGAQFSAPLKIRDPGTLKLSLRQLIQLVFDDHTTLKLFEWLSKPDAEGLGENKVLFAAILNVSIRPGWRTYSGYLGDIDIRIEYGKRCSATGNIERAKRYPHSFAVFPGVDSQVLDLRSGIRRQLALAGMLQAVAPRVTGAGAADYVRRLEQDAASITALNTIVSYNGGGRHFGWHFAPRFQGQVDPASQKGGPGHVLQPQTFPALVLIMADAEDLDKKVGGQPAAPDESPKIKNLKKALGKATTDVQQVERDIAEAEHALQHQGRHTPARVNANLLQLRKDLELANRKVRTLQEEIQNPPTPTPSLTGGEIQPTPTKAPAHDTCGEAEAAPFDHLFFLPSMRWLPAPDPDADRSWWPFASAWSRWQRPRLTEEDVMEWAVRLGRIGNLYGQIQKPTPTSSPAASPTPGLFGRQVERDFDPRYMQTTVSRRHAMLEAASVLLPAYWAIPTLPEKVPPPDFVLTSVAPRQGWHQEESWFVANGKGFDQHTRFFVGGIEAHSVVTSADGKSAVFVIEGFSDHVNRVVDVAAVRPRGGTASLADAIEFKLEPRPKPQSTKAKVEVTWETGSDGKARVRSITTYGDVQAKDVLRAVTPPLTGTSPKTADVDLHLDLDAKTRQPTQP